MTSIDAEPEEFLRATLDELWRARFKHPGEEGELTDAEWLAVLVEEVGEVARAIQDETDDALRAELVQVAAMACRYYVSIPHGRRRPPWAGRSTRVPPSDAYGGLTSRLCWQGPCYAHSPHEWTEDKPRGETFWCPGASTDRT